MSIRRSMNLQAKCISFSKYSFLKKGYVRPYVEIPASYIVDYNIGGFLYAYYLVIHIDNGISKPKKIKISLYWFKEIQVIGIVKSLDHIKRRNISDSKKEVERLLHASF